MIAGALMPGKRIVEGPFGEVHGYMGPQGFQQSPVYEIRAITHRKDAMHQSVITPVGDKPWMDLAREGAYLRRCREAVPGVNAVCKNGRHALLNVFISMEKMSEGDPGQGQGRSENMEYASMPLPLAWWSTKDKPYPKRSPNSNSRFDHSRGSKPRMI